MTDRPATFRPATRGHRAGRTARARLAVGWLALGWPLLAWPLLAWPSSALPFPGDPAPAPSGPVQPAAQAVLLEIPALPLREALTSFGRQTGLQILYSPDLVPDRRSRALSGRMDPAAALSDLLSGTDLAFEMRDGMVTIGRLRESPGFLPGLTVEGRPPPAGPAAVPPDRGRGTGRSGRPAEDPPQGLSTVTREELDQRDVQDINGALAYSAGVRPIDYPGGQGAIDVFIRGFRQSSESVMIDGLRSGYNPYGLEYEPFGVERVEVLKGPSSAVYGAMPPGGAIALTSKRPTDGPLHRLQLQGGSHDRRQVTADLSDRIDADGSLRYRLTALSRRSGTQIDRTPDDRLYIAPALSWAAGERTEITLLASLLDFRKMGAEQSFPASGTVLDNPHGRLESSLFLGYPGLSSYRSRSLSAGYDLRHALTADWTLRQTLRYSHSRVGYLSNWAPSGLLEADRRYRFGLQDRPKTSATLLVDTALQGAATTGPLHHSLLAGIGHGRHRAHETRRNGTVANAIDVFDPVYGGPYAWDATPARDLTDRIRQTGLYAQDEIAFGGWRLTLGGRLDWSRTGTAGRLSDGPPVETTRFDRAFTKRIGLTYRFDGGLSPYAGHSTSFQPNGDSDVQGRPFLPSRGTQMEAGLRYRPEGFDGLFTLSLFRAVQRNLTAADPDNPGHSVQTGQIRSRGVELEARTALSDTADLTAAYGYAEARVTRDTAYPGGTDKTGKRVASVPRHAAAVWLRQHFREGPADGLTAGIGMRYVGATYNAANSVRVPSYMLVDVSLGYDLGRLSPQLDGVGLSLSATNLFDRRYFSPGFYENSVFFGNRRAVLATLSYGW
ncbi:TonB-dependent siderophore receptor [Azospirillum thermophilum]|uniref:TonB-dependent siderophore receptor n=1 Tax=Azospirillum thermophilum TaxID=2202148 RepID=A0A2S2CVU6_9PROT|nr:TonB-dependent siderophore receptor [Azospirillum thermophilum]AWK88515.1 TonB-dependent siderophore receptor [Azospirillum thermophilum]